MNKNKKRFGPKSIVLTAVISVLVTAILLVGGGFLAGTFLLGRDGMAVLEGIMVVNDRFVGEYDRKDMGDGALDGMIAALGDRWSYYMTAEEYAEQTKRRANQYTGVGLTYTAAEDGTMNVVSVVEDGPADKAGIRPGDVIVAIAGRELTAENRGELLAILADEPGVQVEMTLRDEGGGRRTVTVTLANLETDPVSYQMLEGDIGYVRLSNFFTRSSKRTQEAVDELAAQGARGLIFDVRSNPGGYVDQLTDLLDYLLPEGPIFTEHTKDGPVKTTQSDARCVDLPMVVLVNSDSYSAAELFAGQLRESVGAGLVGQVTSGKGYYQQAIKLMNGGAMNISTGMYGTGSGESLRGVGLTPDILEDDPTVQLEKAIELLEREIAARKAG